MRASFLISIVTVTLALGAPAHAASDLNLLCKTEFTRPDGTQTDFLRQYEINFGTGRVVGYDNVNGQFVQNFATNYVRADDRIVVIAQTRTVYHEINRLTGMAFSRMDNGELKRGICSPSSPLGRN